MTDNTDTLALVMKHAKKYPHKVSTVIVAVLEHIANDRALRKK